MHSFYRLGWEAQMIWRCITYHIPFNFFFLWFTWTCSIHLLCNCRYFWLLLQKIMKSIGNEKEEKKRNDIWQLFEEAQQSMFGLLSSTRVTLSLHNGGCEYVIYLVICCGQWLLFRYPVLEQTASTGHGRAREGKEWKELISW